ncbi:MAG TPA: ABC transporter permease [Streptosporangiaceae bacterium]|nr:ABC transporter permease [Streptosporangiaceae bacterium]
MSARPVLRAASGGVTRHRAQTVVLFVVLLVSTASATLGLALLAAASGPFDHAFAAQHGADAAVAVNGSRASNAQLAATARLSGVTGAAGPFGAATVSISSQGFSLPSLVLVGRASPAGPLDDLTLVRGHWPQRPDQIVLSEGTGFFPALGTTMTITTAPGKPVLTVVGVANSVTNTASGWVLPSEIRALRPAGAPATAEMLYRFASAGTAARIRGDVAAVAAALPAGAVAGFSSWLTAQQQANGNSTILAPFVEAFALIGLFMSVLIVGNVVSGAVVASYRRIGVLKSIGFSPVQVVLAYVARVGVPAVTGCLAGLVSGNLLAVPVLHKSAAAFGVGQQQVPLWVNVVTPVVMCALVAVTAFIPALRAGRMSAVQAIALGHAPRQGRGYAAHRLASRLRLPRPVSIGLAAPFARPARTAGTLAAIMFGVTAVIFAVGLDSTLSRAEEGQSLAATAPVQVSLNSGNAWQPASSQDRAILAALRAQPGSSRYVAAAQTELSVGGLALRVDAQAFDGNAGWLGYGVISGHWYSSAGQVVVNTAYLNQTGLTVGDTTTVSTTTRSVTARIVGEIFVPGNRPALMTSVQTLGGTSASLGLDEYYVGLNRGVSSSSYVSGLSRSLGANYYVSGPQGGDFYLVADSLIAMLTLMMAVVAGLGVLNTVLLGTRDRVHDLGVFKAVGMTPRQTIAMVLCWVVAPAIVAAVIAVPVGMVLHSATADAMARAAYTGLPASFMAVYRPAEIALLALSGLVIAAAGALLPASWAAGSKTATALRAE